MWWIVVFLSEVWSSRNGSELLTKVHEWALLCEINEDLNSSLPGSVSVCAFLKLLSLFSIWSWAMFHFNALSGNISFFMECIYYVLSDKDFTAAYRAALAQPPLCAVKLKLRQVSHVGSDSRYLSLPLFMAQPAWALFLTFSVNPEA